MEGTDEKLIERTIAGDNGAFETLVNSYKDFVYTMVVRIVKNESLAEETAQDVFLRAYRALPGFERRSKFSTWLYRIAYNLSLNAIKTGSSGKTTSLDDLPEAGRIAGEDGHYGSSPILDAEKNDLKRVIEEVLDGMPAKYSSIITLYYLKQLSYEEIAGVTKLPMGTVKSHLYRGKVALKSAILERYREEELI